MKSNNLQNDEDRLLLAKVEDFYNLCDRNFCPVFSSFLDERQCAFLEIACRKNSQLNYLFWGGHENAARRVLCVYNDYYSERIIEEFPLKCLTFQYRKSDVLTHRDFLGALMSLQLKRETIGDIIVTEGKTQLFATDIASKLILSSITKIGKVGVKISDEIPFELEEISCFDEIVGTVASLRIDCVASLALKLSREKTARIIANNGVQINYFPSFSCSTELKLNDIFSIKGYGKFILSDIANISKKGRIHITVKKYI